MIVAGYETHPAADLFPMLPAEELEELAADIKAHGQRFAVVVIGDKILDGRNRAKACSMIGVEPRFEQYEGPTDVGALLDYVRSLNLSRRHLSATQRALAAGRALPMYEEAARERQGHGKTAPGKNASGKRAGSDARDVAGAAFHVGGRTVSHAKRVLDKGVDELVRAVERDLVAVSLAAEIAKHPKKAQRRLLKNADGDARVLRELVNRLAEKGRGRPEPPPEPLPRAPARSSAPSPKVTYDGDPGPTEEEWSPDDEPGDSAAAAADRAMERVSRAAEEGRLAPARATKTDRLPPGNGDGFPAAGPPLSTTVTSRPWREVLRLPPGAIPVENVLGAVERMSGRESRAELDRAKALGLSQWFTQEREAFRLAELAFQGLAVGEEPLRILEPSAGAGRLLEPLAGVCGGRPFQVTAYEIDQAFEQALAGLADHVVIGDFIAAVQAGRVDDHDVVISNPPYEGGLDGKFLEAAMRVAPRVVALVRLNALTGRARFDRVWSQVADGSWALTVLEVLALRPGFDGPGTDSAKSDYVIVRLERASEEVAPGTLTQVGWAA